MVAKTIGAHIKMFSEQQLRRQSRHCLRGDRATHLTCSLRQLVSSEQTLSPRKIPKNVKKCQKMSKIVIPGKGGGVSLYKRLDMHFFARTAGRGAAL